MVHNCIYYYVHAHLSTAPIIISLVVGRNVLQPGMHCQLDAKSKLLFLIYMYLLLPILLVANCLLPRLFQHAAQAAPVICSCMCMYTVYQNSWTITLKQWQLVCFIAADT